MLKTIETLADRGQDAYLSDADLDALGTYSKGFALRSHLYEKLGRIESKIVRDLSAADLKEDIRLMLRYAAMAMLLEDAEFLRERYLEWLREHATASGRRTQLAWAADELLRSCARRLWGAEAALVRPYLEQIGRALA
jgi:hypothetical protein